MTDATRKSRLRADQPARASRQNTQLEAAGAEFLVLGQLLIAGIPAFKSYTNFKGYDLTATNADRKKSVRVQVKSRWRTGAEGFIINRIECDFVVIVLLNRGSRDGRAEVRPPEYFVIPAKVVHVAAERKLGEGELFKVPPSPALPGALGPSPAGAWHEAAAGAPGCRPRRQVSGSIAANACSATSLPPQPATRGPNSPTRNSQGNQPLRLRRVAASWPKAA